MRTATVPWLINGNYAIKRLGGGAARWKLSPLTIKWTLRGSFSAVSKPTSATKYSFELGSTWKEIEREKGHGWDWKWKHELRSVASKVHTQRTLLWLHFPLGATLAFLAFCVPWSPEEAFWQRPGAAPLASFLMTTLENSWRDLQDLRVFAVNFAPLRPQYCRNMSSNLLAFSN